ncbi:unnamed protein product [Aphis gossypii]|uniref:Uncharacterized protein n=1 Tax=Aphis gossypii TaxID=80765 RepID=A0A9P0IX98_APHGO|nr:unnamed protein product [Aphis gossypii]
MDLNFLTFWIIYHQVMVYGQIIYVPVSVDTMIKNLPQQIDDDHCVKVLIKRRKIHQTSYLHGIVSKKLNRKPIISTVAIHQHEINRLSKHLKCTENRNKFKIIFISKQYCMLFYKYIFFFPLCIFSFRLLNNSLQIINKNKTSTTVTIDSTLIV